MVEAVEEISLTTQQEAIVTAFMKKYPEASRFTAVKFCFGRKFDLARIYPLYEGYMEVMKARGLQNISAAQVLPEMRTQKMYIPGSRDRKGAALFIVQASKHVIGQFPPESTIKLAYYLGDRLTASLKTQRNGITLIIDLNGTEWSNFDANFMAEIIGFFQNHIPAAVKNILIWRAPWWIRTAIKIVSPFLKEKMRKRIKLCDNLFALLEFVAESDLPVEFGGSFEYDHDYFIRKELAKTSSDDILSALTEEANSNSSTQVDFAGKSTLQMSGAECAFPSELEEELQKERSALIEDLDDRIEFVRRNSLDSDINYYPVPIYDLMQNKIYRLTLDVTADYRPFPGSLTASSMIEEAWRKAHNLDEIERTKVMKEALNAYNKQEIVK